jgi:hypothetical protein
LYVTQPPSTSESEPSGPCPRGTAAASISPASQGGTTPRAGSAAAAAVEHRRLGPLTPTRRTLSALPINTGRRTLSGSSCSTSAQGEDAPRRRRPRMLRAMSPRRSGRRLTGFRRLGVGEQHYHALLAPTASQMGATFRFDCDSTGTDVPAGSASLDSSHAGWELGPVNSRRPASRERSGDYAWWVGPVRPWSRA